MNDRGKDSITDDLLNILFIKKISPAAIIKIYRKNSDNPGALIRCLKGFKKHNMEELFPVSEGRGDSVSCKNISRDPDTETDEIRKFLKRMDIKVLTICDPVYPYILKQIYAPPPVLFYRGKADLLKSFCIAVVGSRKCTEYGKEAAKYIAGGLSETGITVVSGMALGIDSESHNAALKSRGSTIAVLGCGLDRVYPPENRNLFSDIVRKGLVLSEFFPGTPPCRNNFPVRNRIISGLCRGVVIVEAGERSGAVITCELALRQNREVFAVPGNIFNSCSRGCHGLIKSGAKLVERVDDIIEELSGVFKSNGIFKSSGKYNADENQGKPEEDTGRNMLNKKGIEGMNRELSESEKAVLKKLGYRPLSFEKLVLDTGLSPGNVMQALSGLELKDIIKACGTNNYCRREDMTGF